MQSIFMRALFTLLIINTTILANETMTSLCTKIIRLDDKSGHLKKTLLYEDQANNYLAITHSKERSLVHIINKNDKQEVTLEFSDQMIDLFTTPQMLWLLGLQNIYVVSLESLAIQKQISLQYEFSRYERPFGFALGPRNLHLYVSMGEKVVLKFNRETLQLEESIDLNIPNSKGHRSFASDILLTNKGDLILAIDNITNDWVDRKTKGAEGVLWINPINKSQVFVPLKKTEAYYHPKLKKDGDNILIKVFDHHFLHKDQRLRKKIRPFKRIFNYKNQILISDTSFFDDKISGCFMQSDNTYQIEYKSISI